MVKQDGGSTTTRSHTLLTPAFPVREASSAKAATSALTNDAVPSRPFARAFLVAVRTARAALSTCVRARVCALQKNGLNTRA